MNANDKIEEMVVFCVLISSGQLKNQGLLRYVQRSCTLKYRRPVTGVFSLWTANSSLVFQAFVPLRTESLHLTLGLPPGRFPYIFDTATVLMFLFHIFFYSSNIPLLMTVTSGSTIASSRISSFLQYSSRLTRIMRRSWR